jgi:hypothetical protein
MKLINLLTPALLLTTTTAYTLDMYPDSDCGGTPTYRNVYDNTCAYTKGFKSFRLRKHGGAYQIFTAYSRQACVEPKTFQGCAQGGNGIGIGVCHNTDGASNALSSYYIPHDSPCPDE